MPKPVLHGRDHCPGGADPIPCLGGEEETPDSYVDLIQAHPDLVHYWRMGAASGDQPDTSGHAGGPYDLSLQAAGTAGTYDVTGALENGEDDGAWEQNVGGTTSGDHFATATESPRAEFAGTASFTIECWIWINPAWTATGDGSPVSCTVGGSSNGWRLSVTAPTYRLILIRHTTGGYTSVGISAGTWHHIAATYDGTTGRIYVDGELIQSAANAASITSGGGGRRVRVGRAPMTTAEGFWGRVDEVALYSDDLSAIEVLEHATAGKPLGFGNSVKYINATYQMLITDEIILADGAWAPFTITLPTASGIPGQRYIVKNKDAAGTITVSRFASPETIDGATTVSLTGRRAREFVSDGANWQIIGAHL